MNSKIKEYFENKENRIKCGITGGTIALAVVIFTVMVFMEKNETPNIPLKPFHRRKVTHRQKKRQDILSTRAIFTICGWMHRQSKIII